MPEGGRPDGEGRVGDLAIVLHSHMPYVEGFGTYPFGEEWLFDAVVRSYLPVLAFARDIAVSITPVLADQLEAPGLAGRLTDFAAEFRAGSARRESEEAPAELRDSALDELGRYEASLEALAAAEGDLLELFAAPAREGRIELLASAATHAVLPLIATDRAIEFQIGTGLKSHRRRFGRPSGFWLPECAYVPGLEAFLARHGIEWFPIDQSVHETGDEALEPVVTRSGPVAFTIDWTAVSWVWDLAGYPSWPGYRDFHRKSMLGLNLFSIDGSPYDPEAARKRAREDAGRFLDGVAERLGAFRRERGKDGLAVFACDMELMGHWWAEGPIWLEAVLDGAAERGIRLTTPGRELDRPGREDVLMPASWGAGKDLRTWDSPAQADISAGARRVELSVLGAIASGLGPPASDRAAREMLAVQASDWAFLDATGQAGDYPFRRAVDHASAAYEAIHSAPGEEPEPTLRSLSPDLEMAPLTTP
ncbi:MAG: 1,4-alpha-glucan branching protein domain-containing protein [Solirubrobacterales bacterium]